MFEHLSGLAQQIGRHMAERCTNGLPASFGEELLDDFEKEDRHTLGAALAELKADGLVKLTPLIGPKLPRVRTTYQLFVAADPGITGQDPVADSVVLARMMAGNPGLGRSVPKLEQEVGWDRRRFNPALGLLMPLFPKGRYREVVQNDYPTLGFIVTADEVVALQRYARTNLK